MMRVIIAVSVFASAYLATWLVLAVLISDPSAAWLWTLPWLFAFGAAAMSWRRTGEQSPTRFEKMIAWGAIGAFGGFVVGFLGPMMFAPQANQGPLMGLLITAPVGGILGLVGAWWRDR
ncbi:MAG: hypothetical protein V2J42_07800 [Wenzhouxiangella sp.]|jgi:hypothetical protein|nr:hypothetical protein [Wenzhouxiangella sp.]